MPPIPYRQGELLEFLIAHPPVPAYVRTQSPDLAQARRFIRRCQMIYVETHRLRLMADEARDVAEAGAR